MPDASPLFDYDAALLACAGGDREALRRIYQRESVAAIDDRAALAAYAQAGDPFELRSDLGRLHQCLSALEPARRDCILYAYVEGCSHGEIAQRTATPLGTVKAWIQRGMRTLRECMA